MSGAMLELVLGLLVVVQLLGYLGIVAGLLGLVMWAGRQQ